MKSQPDTTEAIVPVTGFPRWAGLGHGLPSVVRLGLATRGNTHLSADDVARAVARGVNYLNWCGYDDGIARAVREEWIDRREVVLAVQLGARTARGIEHQLRRCLDVLGTDSIDVVTFSYVEEPSEWGQIASDGGALEALVEARARGQLSLIGLATHQRRLGAQCAESDKLDLLMIRYNAAHRGAEEDVFPVTERLRLPVVAYTAQRWKALIKPTPGDPPGFTPPHAREWYRFALAHPAVSVVLMAPASRQELEADLKLLDDWRSPQPLEFQRLIKHGRRVRHCAGRFW